MVFLLESAQLGVRISAVALHLCGYIRETIEPPRGCIRVTENLLKPFTKAGQRVYDGICPQPKHHDSYRRPPPERMLNIRRECRPEADQVREAKHGWKEGEANARTRLGGPSCVCRGLNMSPRDDERMEVLNYGL